MLRDDSLASESCNDFLPNDYVNESFGGPYPLEKDLVSLQFFTLSLLETFSSILKPGCSMYFSTTSFRKDLNLISLSEVQLKLS